MSTVETLRVGDRIADKYTIERVLGKGGMGMVVAARHVDLDQVVAIKLILPEALRQQGIAERLLREARASAKLRSEHVAKVTDVGRLPDGAPYLVMELLEGRDLADMLTERTVLPAAEAALYVGQACEAIAEAHAAGIVHRDIKPANLFVVTRRDGSPCVKVLDFGIAKEDGLANAAMTSTGSVLGTPMYMSPEQVRSSKTATPATDIWALGITLYELTTGSIPYDVTTVTELIAKILTEKPIAARTRNPSLPPEMEAVIMRCLEVEPAARYGSAVELQAALAPIASQGAHAPGVVGVMAGRASLPGIVAFPERSVAGLTPPIQQRSFAATGAPAVAPSTLLSQGTVSGTSVGIRATRGSSTAPIVVVAAVAAVGILGGGAAFFLLREPTSPAVATAVPDATTEVAETQVEPAPTPAEPAASAGAAEPAASGVPAGDGSAAAPPASASATAEASASATPDPAAEPAPVKKQPSVGPKPAPAPPPSPKPPPAAKPGWGGLL